MTHKPNFWIRTIQRFKQRHDVNRAPRKEPEIKRAIWHLPHKRYDKHNKGQEMARRRQQIERGMLKLKVGR
jgi:hypothetical protein